MGYYTRFSLTITGETDCDIIEQLRSGCDYAAVALDKDGNFGEECKWYDCREDVLSFSKKHPDILFLLKGEGEEANDRWKFYARSGKSYFQKAKVIPEQLIFEQFNESMLLS